MTVVLEEAPKAEPKQKEPNSLMVVVEAKIGKIDLTVFTTGDCEKDKIYFLMSGLSTEILLHESKKIINLQLRNLELSDILKTYKNPDLRYFLKT